MLSQSFLDNINRLGQEDYVPTNEDILKLNVPGTFEKATISLDKGEITYVV